MGTKAIAQTVASLCGLMACVADPTVDLQFVTHVHTTGFQIVDGDNHTTIKSVPRYRNDKCVARIDFFTGLKGYQFR